MDRAQMAVPPPQAGVLTPEYAFPVQTWSDREKPAFRGFGFPLMAEGGIPFFHGMRGARPGTRRLVWRMDVSRLLPRVRATLSSGARSPRRAPESKNLIVGADLA